MVGLRGDFRWIKSSGGSHVGYVEFEFMEQEGEGSE